MLRERALLKLGIRWQCGSNPKKAQEYERGDRDANCKGLQWVSLKGPNRVLWCLNRPLSTRGAPKISSVQATNSSAKLGMSLALQLSNSSHALEGCSTVPIANLGHQVQLYAQGFRTYGLLSSLTTNPQPFTNPFLSGQWEQQKAKCAHRRALVLMVLKTL